MLCKKVRSNRGVRARDVATIALTIYQARDALSSALDACGGKIKTQFMDSLLAEMRRLESLAFSLEDDYLKLAGRECPGGDRAAPLLGDTARAQAALQWLTDRGV